ncbi:MAG: translation initiation factor IF-3, partial [Aquificaceae bacterium]|nr:translation initiation factor IF-3 [Aquificaceae bacterium]
MQEYRVNRQIRVKEVRLIDENGKQIGIVPIQEALRIASEKGLDLVEIAPQ